MENEKGIVPVNVGWEVTFVDCKGIHHPALVTAVWGETSINLVYVSDDEKEVDPYGRQIKRETSVVHSDLQSAGGNYWK